MRVFSTTVMAFFLSMFAGALVAQQLAVATNAGEEYILVFMSIGPLAIVFVIVFLIAQLRADPRRAVNAVAAWSLGVMAILSIALLGFDYFEAAGNIAKVQGDLPILAGLMLPGFVIVLVDWLFVRWRVGRAAPVEKGQAA